MSPECGQTKVLLKISEAAIWMCCVKKVFLEISQNSQEINFIKKETLAQVFSCEF